MKRILVSDKLSAKGVEVLKQAGFQVDVKTGLPPEEQKAIIKEYDGLVIRSATKVTRELIEAADNLKVIGRAGSGLDNVDIAAASKRGIVVMNTPGGNTITTAEHAVSMMLSLARHIPQATRSIKDGKWEKGKFMGTEIHDHTIGIIGTGNVGSVVAGLAKGLGMQVIAYDPYISSEKAKKIGIELVSLDEIYRRSDFITVHSPLTSETRNLINAVTIAKMKDGVYIINCARGGIVNEKELAEAIKNGKVAGAALDVFEKEPPQERACIDLDQVICTPHLGASTTEAQENVAVAVAHQIVDYLTNGTIKNAVNVPSVPAELMANLKPYINLAERLGKFQGNIISGGIKQITIEYSGVITAYDTRPVTISLIKGLLDPVLNESINFVNAPHVAKDRGIKVVESTASEPENFTQLIKVHTKTDEMENTIEGTIFGLSDPRIVKIDQFEVECIPEGHIIFLYNHDKPGVIGNIGKVLGERAINIASMHVGRDKETAKALIILATDSSLPTEIVENLKSIDHIIDVHQLNI